MTDSSTGAPLEGASVTAQTGTEATSQAIHRAVTDSTGAYTLSDLDAGDYQVSARMNGYQLKTQTATVGNDPVTLDFPLDPGNGLTIQATDGTSGMPLGGLVALAFGTGGTIAYQGSVTLDSTGTGQVPSLPPGRYAVYLFSSGYAPHSLPNVTVPSPTIPVTLTPGGRIEARASAADARTDRGRLRRHRAALARPSRRRRHGRAARLGLATRASRAPTRSSFRPEALRPPTRSPSSRARPTQLALP